MASSGFMHDFYVYEGKNTEDPNNNTDYSHLSKSAQVIAKLVTFVQGDMKHKVYFDNWFTTVELLHYLKEKKNSRCWYNSRESFAKMPYHGRQGSSKAGKRII